MVEVNELLDRAEAAVAASLSTPHQERGPVVARAGDLYARAWAAVSDLEPDDAVRLRCALGYASFLYRDVSRGDAGAVARGAVDAAELAGVGHDPLDPAARLVGELRGKLAQWAGDPCAAGLADEDPEFWDAHR